MSSHLVSLVGLIAWVSVWIQVDGLIGPLGIIPVSDTLHIARQVYPQTAHFMLPSLFWLTGDNGLNLVLFLGITSNFLTFCRRPAIRCSAYFCSAIAYLSLVNFGHVFFSYQWDSLLLESLFLFALRPLIPCFWWQLALRLLLFKLLFLSGYVKWASLDPSWRNLSALPIHFLTQPLPHALGMWVYELPLPLHQAAVVLLFFIEGLAPFLLFVPGSLFRYGIAIQILLQIMILLTGSFGWFNLLTIALLATVRPEFRPKLPGTGLSCLAGLHALISLLQIGIALNVMPQNSWPLLSDFLHRTRWNNRYGLFATMTTTRLEISVHVSEDCKNYSPMRFIYKPDPGIEIPAWAGFHMPRLDWQMWFAALAPKDASPWFNRFLEKVILGSAPVHSLLGNIPPINVKCVRTPMHEVSIKNGRFEYEYVGEWAPVITSPGI